MIAKSALLRACTLLLCVTGFSASAAEPTENFTINNGLAKPEISDRALANRKMYDITEPNYTGTVESTLVLGDYRATSRIELRQHFMDGTGGQSWPTLWQPDSFCETLLEKPVPLPGVSNAWILRASIAAKLPETACDIARQLGSVGGVKHLIVRQDPTATSIGFTVEVFGHFQEEPLARGTLHQGTPVVEVPARAIFNEASLTAAQYLATYPALITAEVKDRHGVVHPLSVHRVQFSDHKLPVLNVYDHYSGCVFERSDPAPDADTAARFRLVHTSGNRTVQHKCDRKKQLQSRIFRDTLKNGVTEMPWVGDMIFERQADGTYALLIEGKDMFMSFNEKPKPEPIARGTAQVTGKGSLYVDHMPVDGLRRINEYFLIANDGFFRIDEHWRESGQLAAYVIEVTDLNSFFAKGDAAARVSWYAPDQALAMTWYQRTKSGKCSDTLGNSERLKFYPIMPGVWRGQSSDEQSKESVCVAPVIRLDTCEQVRCLQWNETMHYPNPETYLTADEAKARELWAKVTKWTRASTGLQYDPETFNEEIVTGNDSPYPFGECGLEGCEAKRNRELTDDFIRDIWDK